MTDRRDAGIEGEDADDAVAAAGQLARALDRLRARGGAIPTMPYPVLRALKGLVPLAVAECAIRRGDGAVLVTWRDDAHWRGWHLPGGFMAPDEPLDAACARIAQRELGASVVFDRLAGAHVWHAAAHPYASAVSLICLCRAAAEPNAIDAGRWVDRVPPDMVPAHRGFLAVALADQPGAPVVP